jgi:peptide-N4-(N-acetyl-beta-glucosaminyl)asparagine amidase
MATATPSRIISREASVAFSLISSRLTTHGSSWPDPQLSIRRWIGTVEGLSCWEARGPAREAYHIPAPKIKAYLERSIEPVSSLVTWSIYMLGKAPLNASPIVLFFSQVKKHRKQIKDAVKESGLLNEFPGMKTGHMPRPPASATRLQPACTARLRRQLR